MQFSSIVGNEAIKRQLIEMVRHNRLSHALLFLGKEGSGALPMALAMAQYVVCSPLPPAPAGPSLFGEEEPVAADNKDQDACGKCPACQKAEQLVHPDIHFSYPVVTKKSGTPPLSTDYIVEWRKFIKEQPYGNVYDWLQFIEAENKQGNITANECNEIIRKLSLKSFESEYKVLVMWMPEYLGNEGNKLLKLIEEPPPNTLFILVAENEEQILQTILSRCQLVKIPSPTNEEVEQALIARGADAKAAHQAAKVSDGNFREALQTIEHSGEDWLNYLRDWMNAALRTGPLAQTKWVDAISKIGREKQKQFLLYATHIIQLAIKQRIGVDGLDAASPEYDFVSKLNKRVADISIYIAFVDELNKASYYIERNANAKMLFHALTIKLHRIFQNRITIG